MDERVEADDGVKETGREIQLVSVGANEGGCWYELTSTLNLDVTNVHAGHLVPGVAEVTGNRDAAPASDVKDLAVLREAVSQVCQPAVVVVGGVVIAAVVARESVVTGTHHIGLIGVHYEQAILLIPARVSSDEALEWF